MASGLTAPIYDGDDLSFRGYALRCARWMGPLIILRDEPLEAGIPAVIEPDPHHKNQARRAYERLRRFRQMTDHQADLEAQGNYDQLMAAYRNDLEQVNVLRARYQVVLDQTIAWQAPNDVLEPFKEFMVRHLQEEIDSDCRVWGSEPTRLTGRHYRIQAIEHARQDMRYHIEKYREEVRRARERTEWVQALLGSLEQFEPVQV